MKYLNYILNGLLSAVVLTACSNPYTFGLIDEKNVYGQHIEYNYKVDVLWVVDTSSSMAHHQENIGQQIHSFVDVLRQKGMDFRMAVTTMDMSSGGEKGSFIGEPKVLLNSNPNLIPLFRQAIMAGEEGSSFERGFESMKEALSDEKLNGVNSGFLRNDAMLAVVFISNEDDGSAGSAADYADILTQLKPDTQYGGRSWLVNFIGITDPGLECLTTPDFEYTDPGDDYMSLVDFSGGVSVSICSEHLAQSLSEIRERISSMITEYPLSTIPQVETIKVSINGQVIANDKDNGWTYHDDLNVIRFHGSAIPAANGVIVVDFTPIGPK